MAISSHMLTLGTLAPDFSLPEVVRGDLISLDRLPGQEAFLIMFLCRHCPYVIHIQQEVVRLGQDFGPQGVGMVAISSNDAQRYPDDHPSKLKEMVETLGCNFPFCYDESQEVARSYHAACTPDFFLFDAQRRLVYRGQLDDSRPNNGLPVTGADLRLALQSVLSGVPVSPLQKPSLGCGIKWK